MCRPPQKKLMQNGFAGEAAKAKVVKPFLTFYFVEGELVQCEGGEAEATKGGADKACDSHLYFGLGTENGDRGEKTTVHVGELGGHLGIRKKGHGNRRPH